MSVMHNNRRYADATPLADAPRRRGMREDAARFGGGPFGSRQRRRVLSQQYLIFRYVWWIAWSLLARWTPAPLFRWRRLVLVAFGAQLHPTAKIYPMVDVFDPRKLRMGRHTVIGRGTRVYNVATVTLDDYADVAWGVDLVAASHDLDDLSFTVVSKPIRIGRFAWVAVGAFVGCGVTVGEGAVLGARSVAFTSLKPWTIYVGNLAAAIRPRAERARAEAQLILAQASADPG